MGRGACAVFTVTSMLYLVKETKRRRRSLWNRLVWQANLTHILLGTLVAGSCKWLAYSRHMPEHGSSGQLQPPTYVV